MGGRTINCSFIPPLYEGYWFRTQSLLLGNPTNPSMAVLGPLWLYEAVHWQIVPTKEYKGLLIMMDMVKSLKNIIFDLSFNLNFKILVPIVTEISVGGP